MKKITIGKPSPQFIVQTLDTYDNVVEIDDEYDFEISCSSEDINVTYRKKSKEQQLDIEDFVLTGKIPEEEDDVKLIFQYGTIKNECDIELEAGCFRITFNLF